MEVLLLAKKQRGQGVILKKISTRQIRKSIQRGQLRIRKRTLEVRRARSLRGRTQLMEAPAPGQPTQAQGILAESTAIRRFKYFIEEKRLRVWFTTGHVYDYFGVPEAVVLILADAQSKGRTFHALLYGTWVGKSPHKQLISEFPYKRIR
jgi:hypothetical protein